MGRGNVPFKSQLKYNCTYPRRHTARSAKGYEQARVCGGCWGGAAKVVPFSQLFSY